MIRTFLTSTTALASLIGMAVPAFAQAPAPAPAPMMAPAPAMAPAMAPMAAPEATGVMPPAPMMAPLAPDDMTGSVGFGVGVGSSATTTTLITTDNTISIKYWMSDAMALVPKLTFAVTKQKGSDAAWQLAPELLASFVLLKGASTRLTAGVGLGFGLGKTPPAADTTINLYIPVQLGVEHFFARWFSMGVGVGERFFDFTKTGDAWQMALRADTTQYMGYLMVYTD
jgi:hypothetical protein